MNSTLDLARIKELVRDDIAVNPRRFWVDLLMSAGLGWGFFFFAVFQDLGSLTQILAMIPATLLLYRGQTFIHEIAHIRNRIPGFERAYNLILGYPNNFPTYIYHPHSFHHGRSTFGTMLDPEYAPVLERSKASVLMQPFVLSTLLPLYQSLRFAVLPLFYPLLSMDVKRKIYIRLSTLALNREYRRPLRSDDEVRRMQVEDLKCAVVTWLVLAAVATGILPASIIVLWAVMNMAASTMNMIRAKLNHRYDHDFSPRSPEESLRDSVSIDQGWWTELWAPLSLSYHSLHHLVPAIPYHNLRRAHRKLMRELGPEHPYAQTVATSALQAVRQLLKACGSAKAEESILQEIRP